MLYVFLSDKLYVSLTKIEYLYVYFFTTFKCVIEQLSYYIKQDLYHLYDVFIAKLNKFHT